jgi:hypothetical protein
LRGTINIISREHLRKRRNITFHCPADRQPTANDPHGSLILVMHNNFNRLHTLPGEFTSLIVYKGVGPSSTHKTLWH